MTLHNKILEIQKSPINQLIESRLKEFSKFSKKSDEEWFYELCFCILAANSRQKTAEIIQKSLNEKLLTFKQEELSEFIKKNKHRFHNNKARYIIEARRFHPIRNLINKNEFEAREWLVKNVKGLGMKEASHFLRNTGEKNLAILDRHILRVLNEEKIIDEIPKSLTIKNYLRIEDKFIHLARELKISPAKLDLILWYIKTGEVAK